jgi:hypothetical protein
LDCLVFNGIEYPAANVNANVPDVVIGFPEIDNPVGTDMSTDVTPPPPPAHVLFCDRSKVSAPIVSVRVSGTALPMPAVVMLAKLIPAINQFFPLEFSLRSIGSPLAIVFEDALS